MQDIDKMVEEVEQRERNVADFEDSRFGEIYLDDKQEAFND